MAVSSELMCNSYIATGLSRYDFTFSIISKERLSVFITNRKTAKEIRLAYLKDYDVVVNKDDIGGYILLTNDGRNLIEDGFIVTLIHTPDFLQEIKLKENDAFYVKTIEDMVDKVTYIAQYLRGMLDRAIMAPHGVEVDNAYSDIVSLSSKCNEVLSDMRVLSSKCDETLDECKSRNEECLLYRNEAKDIVDTANRNISEGSLLYKSEIEGIVELANSTFNEGTLQYKDEIKDIIDRANSALNGVYLQYLNEVKDIVALANSSFNSDAINNQLNEIKGMITTPQQIATEEDCFAGIDDTKIVTPKMLKKMAQYFTMPNYTASISRFEYINNFDGWVVTHPAILRCYKASSGDLYININGRLCEKLKATQNGTVYAHLKKGDLVVVEAFCQTAEITEIPLIGG